MSTMGPAYDPLVDEPDLTDQRNKIKTLMLGLECWATLQEIAGQLGYPEASVSAQLRHLRKEQFGGYQVDKRRREGQRVWEYRVRPPVEKGQALLFPEPNQKGGAYVA